MKLKCLLGHDYSLVAEDNEFGWIDEGGNRTRTVCLSFYRCKRCGKRHSKGWNAEGHGGAAQAMTNWNVSSVLPSTSIAPVKKTSGEVVRLVK
jgi:hypothetical protein